MYAAGEWNEQRVYGLIAEAVFPGRMRRKRNPKKKIYSGSPIGFWWWEFVEFGSLFGRSRTKVEITVRYKNGPKV